MTLSELQAYSEGIAGIAEQRLADERAIRNGVRSLCARKAAAVDSFIAYVVEQIGCTDEQAANVYNAFRKHRCIKTDAVNGTWHVSHGALLDVEVLRYWTVQR